MSTNATISVVHRDNTVNTIYLHWDGYPDHALTTLNAHYNEYDKVAKLCELGDLSALYASADCPIGHSFKNPVDGYCIFYGRDRGEDDVAPKAYNSKADIDCHQEYNYIFEDGSWSQL